MKLKLSRQYLEDLSLNFLPFMLKSIESNIRLTKGTDNETLNIIAKSIMLDIDVMFKRKLLTTAHKFSISLKEAEGIIFMKLMLQFPIPADHWWRVNLRNQIVEQLDKQIV